MEAAPESRCGPDGLPEIQDGLPEIPDGLKDGMQDSDPGSECGAGGSCYPDSP
jgi:hypothetical protein